MIKIINLEKIMKRKAVIINSPQSVDLIEEELSEAPLSADEVFIESIVSVISPGTELSRVYGLKKGATYPARPGYCCVGKVINKGLNVSSVNQGDMVLFLGTHASHHRISIHSEEGKILYKFDQRLSPKEGAMIMMCWIALNGILPVDVKLFDTVAVFGMGNLGLFLSIYYQSMGIKVIGIDPVSHRCDVARSIGLTHVIDCAPQDQIKAIMALTDNKGADIVVDATGLSQVIETAIAVSARYGTVVLLGSPRTDYTTNVTPMLNAIHMRNLKVLGALNQLYPFEAYEGDRITKRRGMDHIVKLMLDKTIDVDQFISHSVKPVDIMSAYDGLMNHKESYTSVVVDWTL